MLVSLLKKLGIVLTLALWPVISIGQTPTSAPNENAVYVSAKCGAQLNCFTVKGDVKFTPFAAWTSGGSTVSTSSSAPTFSTSDIGKIVFGTSNCSSGNGNINCILQIPQGTITGFTDAHHITVSTIANATSSSIAWFIWGTQDDAPVLQNAFAKIISSGGGDLYLPCNSMYVQSAPFIVTAQHFYPINIHACADGMIVPTPSFNYSGSCGGANTIYGKGCIFADWFANQLFGSVQSPGVTDHISDMIVWGGGTDGGSISTSLRIAAIVGGNLYIENSEVVGWNWNTTNNIANGQSSDSCGFDVASSLLLNAISWSADSCGLVVEPEMISNQPTTIIGGYFGPVGHGSGMDIRTGNSCNNNGCPTYSYASTFYQAVSNNSSLLNGAVLVSGQWHSNGDVTEALTQTGGTAYFEGLEDNYGSVSGFVQSGGIAYAHNSDLKGLNQSGGTLYNEGGNGFSSLVAASGTSIQLASGETGTSACVSSTKSITLIGTYNSTPTITVSDETTAGGARVSTKSNTVFTVTCIGATDSFDYSVFANPN